MEIDLHSFLPWWLAGYFPIFFIPLLKFKRIQLRFMIQRRGPPNNWDMVFFSRDMGTWRFTSGTSRGQDFIVRDWSLGSSKDQDAALAALEVHHVFPRIELRALCEGGRLQAEASAEKNLYVASESKQPCKHGACFLFPRFETAPSLAVVNPI